MKFIVLFTVMLLATPAAALDETERAAILDLAQGAYERGIAALASGEVANDDFAESAERFEQLIDDGIESAGLHYNAGNAYLRLDDLGRAIYHYRRAEQLDPSDVRTREHLALARSRRMQSFEETGGQALSDVLLGWQQRVSLSSRVSIGLTAWGAFWLVILWWRMKPGPAPRWMAAVSATAWIACSASVLSTVFSDERPFGVVITDEVIVRSGNGAGFEPKFRETLTPGVEFDVIEARGDWLHIALPGGRDGWVERDSVAL